MRVDQTLAGEAAAAARAANATRATAKTGLTSFASALSGAAASGSTARKATAAAATETKTGSETSAKEKTKPVEGKEYVEIVSGPRNGMFINRSGNARDGEAFVLVKKDGRDVHIYGSGKDRETVVVWHTKNKQPTAGDDGVPKGEVSSRVEGELYDEITAGPRNGMFINRSGNTPRRPGLRAGRARAPRGPHLRARQEGPGREGVGRGLRPPRRRRGPPPPPPRVAWAPPAAPPPPRRSAEPQGDRAELAVRHPHAELGPLAAGDPARRGAPVRPASARRAAR